MTAPPPEPVSSPLPPEVEGKENPGTQQAIKDLERRLGVGYTMGVVSILGAIALLLYSFCSLPETPKPEPMCSALDSSLAIHAFYVRVGGHVLITVAALMFLYQLLRASERLVLPSAWALQPEIARTMLGIRSPAKEAMALFKEALSTLAAGKSGAQ